MARVENKRTSQASLYPHAACLHPFLSNCSVPLGSDLPARWTLSSGGLQTPSLAHIAAEVVLLELFPSALLYIFLLDALIDWLPRAFVQSSPKSLLRESWNFKSYTLLRIPDCRFQCEFQKSRILKAILGWVQLMTNKGPSCRNWKNVCAWSPAAPPLHSGVLLQTYECWEVLA